MLFIEIYSLMIYSLTTNIHSFIVQTPKRWENINISCREAKTCLREVWVCSLQELRSKGGIYKHKLPTTRYTVSPFHEITVFHSQNINFVSECESWSSICI